MKTPVTALTALAPALLWVTPALAQTAVTLQAGEEPEQKAWTQPAQISFTSAKGAKDSWALDAALRAEFQPNPSSDDAIIVRTLAQISTAEKSKVQNFQGEVGYSFNWGTDTSMDAPDPDAFYLYGDIKVGAKDKTIFADPKAVCAAIPRPAACGKQHETSLTGAFVLQPFLPDWENTFYVEDGKVEGPAFTHSFSPVVTFFYDEILSAKVNASGIRPDGSVMGSKVDINTAFSPRFTDYRLVLKASGSWTYAAQRSVLRKENFKRSSTVFKLSADYELGKRAFEKVDEGGAFIPALGVTYTKGDDPISGKLDQDSFVVALKITFRSK